MARCVSVTTHLQSPVFKQSLSWLCMFPNSVAEITPKTVGLLDSSWRGSACWEIIDVFLMFLHNSWGFFEAGVAAVFISEGKFTDVTGKHLLARTDGRKKCSTLTLTATREKKGREALSCHRSFISVIVSHFLKFLNQKAHETQQEATATTTSEWCKRSPGWPCQNVNLLWLPIMIYF